MVCKKLRALLIIMVLSVVTVFAGTTGKIRGKVLDAATGEGIPGATVLVDGTQLGASTGVDGSYFILQVPPGLHRVKCIIVGYTTLIQENIIISADTTTTVDFKMSTKLAGQDEVIVSGKKPIVQKDNTSSQKSFDSQQISKLVNPTMSGVLQQQAGVTTGADGALHVRGGRSDEVNYIIDGVSMNSSMLGGTNFNLQSDAIEEMKVVTGGFNAEYGGVMSSIVRVITKSGQKEFHGKVKYLTSNPNPNRVLNALPFGTAISDESDGTWGVGEDYGIEEYTAFLSGPLPNPFVKDASFSMSASFSDDNTFYRFHPKSNFLIDTVDPADFAEFSRIGPISDTTDPDFDSTTNWLYTSGFEPYAHGYRPEGYNRSWKYYANISMRPMKTLKVSLVGNSQIGHDYNNYLFQGSRMYRFLETPDTFSKNEFYTLSIIHTLSSSMFYEASLSSQLDYAITDQNGMHFTEFDGYATDNVYSANVNLGYLSIANTYSYQQYTGFAPFYERYSDSAIKGAFALTFQADRINQLKVGFGIQTSKLYYEYYSSLTSELSGQDFYQVEPYTINAFAQDKIEVEDMVINIGARLEYYNPNTDYYVSPGAAVISHLTTSPKENIFKGTYDAEMTSSVGKLYVMPRLGLSYPLSDTGVFRFSYGHFYQYPTYQYVFSHIQRPLSGDYLGNPELEAQKSVQYEVGFDQGLSDELAINITGYYKEVSDVLSLTKFFDVGKTFYKYVNKDFGRIMGMDISLRKNFSNNFSFDVSYGFSMAKGSSSTPNENITDLANDDSYIEPIKTTYLTYDRRHTLSLSTAVSFGRKEGFDVFGVKPLENVDLSVSVSLESGLPYTRTNANGDDISEKNEARMPMEKMVDLKFSKGFNLTKQVTAKLVLEADNVFNWANLKGVNSFTGKSSAESVDPNDFNQALLSGRYQYWMVKENYTLLSQYGQPRIVRFGVEVSF